MKKAKTGECDIESGNEAVHSHERKAEAPPRLDMVGLLEWYRVYGAYGTYLYARLKMHLQSADRRMAWW